MRYKVRGHEVRSENAAKPGRVAASHLIQWLKNRDHTRSALDYGCGKLRYTKYLAHCSGHIGLVDSEIQLSRTQKIDGQAHKDGESMEAITGNYTGISERYQRMRSASRELNDIFLERCKPPVKQAAKELGVLVDDTIVMDVDRMPVVMDYAIHHCRQDGCSVVDHFADEHPPSPGSDTEAVLAGMQRSFFSVFLVRHVVENIGVHVTDILRDREHFLSDIGISESAVEGVVLASRVLPFDDFIMTTGAPLRVDLDILKLLADSLDGIGLSREDLRNMPDNLWAHLETTVIKACLLFDDVLEMTYEELPEDMGPPPIRNESPRIGRNDPCPCGSGRKYKKCCGR